jgi:hypothetical protein
MTFMNTKFSLLLIPLLFACFALSRSIQAASLNVNVLNTPTVNVATMPPLLIDSSTTNPVLVKDVDNPARQPFTFHEVRTYNFGEPQTFSFQVPTGKRLVIEQVSVLISGGVTNLRVVVSTIFPAGQSNSFHFLGTQVIQPDNAEFIASSQMRCYADEGTTALIALYRYFTGLSAGAEVTVSGYLIDLP